MGAGLSEIYNQAELNKLLDKLSQIKEMQADAEAELFKVQMSNAEKLANLRIAQINKEALIRIEKEQAVNERLIKLGIDATRKEAAEALRVKLKALEDEEKAKLSGAESKAEEQRIKNKYKKEREAAKQNNKEAAKDLETINKTKEKQDKKRFAEAKKMASETFGNVGDLFIANAAKTQEAVENLMAEGYTEEEAKKAVKGQKMQVAVDAAMKAFDGFAKELESTIKDAANSRTAIDTRLQGSNNRRWLGSYWEAISQDIIMGVGMSPFIKQASVVESLKTLVGQGIAFNVEQRAFLDTISDKIATTFEATDATLLKLVRIQQADTTAARLGMESALTAFLNNMYETTEYMQSAASSIRASLYEASALMGATQATAFEYQVQKWMGSLYSVGFNNTEGLAGALGKLAAGDISGITNGGYGNLLIMAANRANLSIAEILAKGLDDSETNQLLKSMVEYLGEIYAETKNSKVVQQQFANVFGLTASDLKAAANLFGSTDNISGNNLNYGGMLKRLRSMASFGSLAQRTSIGEMMTNLFDNLKYATANTIGNNPILYATYEIASMLDDVAGGIAIPAFSVMGNMVDLETTVADLMRVASVGTGLLGGLGQMIAGLAMSGGDMLKSFGISGNGITVLSRGTGTGLAGLNEAAVSESGFIGNSNASDIQGKTVDDASQSANEDLNAKKDEEEETKLSTVDSHIIQIYDLLNNVVNGADSLKVSPAEGAVWTSGLFDRF